MDSEKGFHNLIGAPKNIHSKTLAIYIKSIINCAVIIYDEKVSVNHRVRILSSDICSVYTFKTILVPGAVVHHERPVCVCSLIH